MADRHGDIYAKRDVEYLVSAVFQIKSAFWRECPLPNAMFSIAKVS